VLASGKLLGPLQDAQLGPHQVLVDLRELVDQLRLGNDRDRDGLPAESLAGPQSVQPGHEPQT
jgi:hypothetical protein